MSEPTPDNPYGEGYYASSCGPIAYDRSQPHWAAFFGKIADDLVRTFRPQRVFDAGCAMGFLVEALWDRGVVTHGRDISDYAISKTRADIRPFCSVGSLADPIEGRFDLVACIEVLEHMTEQDGMRAIANMTQAADIVVFSSSPDDLREATHINVKPAIYWMRAFAEHGFAPLIETTLFSITPYAVAFERKDTKPSEAFLSACAEIIRNRMEAAAQARATHELSRSLAEKDQALAEKDQAIAAEAAGRERLAAEQERLTAEKDRLVAEQASANAAMAQLAAERESAQHERDRLLSEYDHACADRDRLMAERDRLLEECNRARSDLSGLINAHSQFAGERDRLEKERLETIRLSLNQIVEMNAHLRALNDQIGRSRLWRLGRKVRRAVDLGRSQVLRRGRKLEMLTGPAQVPLSTAEIGMRLGLDPEFYLAHYPDIANAGIDPLEHYVLHGQHEGRAPSMYMLEKTRRLLPEHVAGREQHAPEFLRLHDLCDPEHEESGPKVSDDAFLISVITPTYNVEPRYVRELHQTLANQSYANWEWVVVDDGSTRTAAIPVLRAIAERDSRVRFTCNPDNLGIAGASNAALALARGQYVALVDHDDLVSRDAFLSLYRAWTSAPRTDLFYTDECKLQPDGRLTDFWAKPDWSPAYLEYTMCVAHLSLYRREFLVDLGGFRSEVDGAQDYDLALRASLQGPSVVHVPVFAYLWRAIPGSAATSTHEKPYAISRQERAVFDYARQRHPEAIVGPGHADGFWRVKYPLPAEAPLLSYIIPAGGSVRPVRGAPVDLVLNCIRSFEEKRFYPNREYIVVHNGRLAPEQIRALNALPGVRLLVHTDPAFNFSRTVNAGVAAARGEYICLLNDDIEAITPQGGEEIVSYLAVNSRVGALGPKCLFEDGRIQQCGVMLLDAAGPVHAATGMSREFAGHHCNVLCRREVYCVGAAIVFLRKSVFEEVGGFREDLPLNYNDVDFCLRVRDRGYTCVADPAVEVYHFESATKIGTAMVEQERMFLGRADMRDPYFSKWFDPRRPDFHLNREAPDLLRPFGPWLDRHIARRAAALDQSPLQGRGPRISICLLVSDQPVRILDEALRSATMQTHDDVQVLVLEQNARTPESRRWFQSLERRGIPTIAIGVDAGAFARTVLDRMDGAFVVFLDASDFISVDAMQILAHAIAEHPSSSLFYTDQYEASEISTRARPFFKPDFDPVLLSNLWFASHLLAARSELVRQVCEAVPGEPLASVPYQLAVRAVLNGEEPRHVRELTYARRTLADEGGSPADSANLLRAVTALLGQGGHRSELTVEAQSPLLRLSASAPVPNVTVLAAETVWGNGGIGLAGLKTAAAQDGVEWVALLLGDEMEQGRSLRELSAPALFDKRVNLVSGVLLDSDVVQWSGGLFLPGGRVFDPQAGQAMATGGYQNLLSCQRCVDVGAPVNVLFRAAAILRVLDGFDIKDADGLMVALGLDAHERAEFVCVTPHVRAAAPRGFGKPPADRRGLALDRPSLVSGSRWYDGRLEVERPYQMPGCG